MTTENATSAPAGGENTATPAGEMPAILSIDDAAQRWMDNEDAEAANPAEAGAPSNAETAQAATETAEAAVSTGPEAGEAQTQPEEVEFIDWDRISPDKKMRLRDGFEFDKKFVNENIDKIRKLPEIERELTARVQQFRDAQAQHAQKEQFLAQALPLAIANAQAAIPQEPEPPVYDPSNPVGFLEQQAEYQKAVVYRNRKIDELRQLQWAQAQQAQANQQQQAVQTKAYIAEQQQALFTAIPRLRDKSEREKFHADYVQLAQDLGFSPQEYGQAVDHRVMRMADLAMDGLKYRKLKAEPPKPKPAAAQAQTPPVAEPGKRQTAEAAAAAKRQELISRARRTGGSVTDIARLVAELD